jgi:hypothetical protein
VTLLNPANRRFLTAVSKLLYANPFLPEMIAFEREALGKEAIEEEPTWSLTVSDPDRVRTNSWRILHRLEPLLKTLRASLASGVDAAAGDLALYEDGLLFAFYYRYYQRLYEAAYQYSGGEKSRWLYYR